MPYGRNYSLVIDSYFHPYSFEERLKPLSIYAEAYKEAENTYTDLNKEANKFAYLARITDNDDPAKQIYEKYANDLAIQAQDLSKNGLSIANRRALTDLKRRYSGEMGLLEQADERLKADRKYRDEMRAKGVHMLYANENPKLSDYLYEQSPNQYGISTDDLYKSGALLGKSLSSREYAPGKDVGSTLGGFYRVWEEAKGVPPEKLAEYLAQPQVQALVENALIANGVAGNLTGKNLELAKRSMLQGIYDNMIYEKSQKPVKDESRMTPYQQAQLNESIRSTNLNAALYGLRDTTGRGDWASDPSLENLKTKYGSSTSGTSKTGTGAKKEAGANKITQSSTGLRVKWKGNNPSATNGDADLDYDIENIANDDNEHQGKLVNYDKLPAYAKKLADEIIGDADDADLYQYYFQPYESSFFGDTEAVLEVVPRKIQDFRQPGVSEPSIFDLH